MRTAIDFAGVRRRRGVGGVERNGMPHVLFMLIYPSSIENALREKKKKVKYSGSYGKNWGRFFIGGAKIKE